MMIIYQNRNMSYNDDNQFKTAKKHSIICKCGGFLLLLQNEIMIGSMVLYKLLMYKQKGYD